MISYVNWSTDEVLQALGFSPSHRLTGIHLSLDGLRVEARIESPSPALTSHLNGVLTDVSND